MDQSYPELSTAVSSHDQEFDAPGIKVLLRQKIRLMCGEQIDEANALAARIGSTTMRRNLLHFCPGPQR